MNSKKLIIFTLSFLINITNLFTQDLSNSIINSAIAKNLAISLQKSSVDPEINFIAYQRGLKKDLFSDSQTLSDIQNQTLNKLNKDLFKSILTSFNDVQKLLIQQTKDQNQIKNIISKLDEMIKQITKVISLSSMFDQFDKIGIFNDFEKIKEIKDFLDSLRSQKKVESKVQADLSDFILLAAGGMAFVSINFVIGESLKDVNELDYLALKKSFIESDAIKFNKTVHGLIEKIAKESKKPISFEEVFNKIENKLIDKGIHQDFINKIRVLNDLPIKTNSELFKILDTKIEANKDVEGISLDWEKDYLKALNDKNPKKISDLIDNIKFTADQNRITIEKDYIFNLMKEHSDISKVFDESVIRRDILKVPVITDLISKLKLNADQINTLKSRISELRVGDYVKIHDSYYKIRFGNQLEEVLKPTELIMAHGNVNRIDLGPIHPIVK